MSTLLLGELLPARPSTRVSPITLAHIGEDAVSVTVVDLLQFNLINGASLTDAVSLTVSFALCVAPIGLRAFF